MTNPTGKEIRNDPAGSGEFGAPRGFRPHYGEDYLCEPGQLVKAPISGKLTRIAKPYASDGKWLGLEIKNDNFICHMYYVEPFHEKIGDFVKQGTVVGVAQDVTERYPHQDMQPHIHVQVWVRPSLFM